MAKIRNFAALAIQFAMITGVLALADFLFFTGNHGVTHPQTTSTQKIENEDLGKNRYLSLNEKFDIGSIAEWSDGVDTQTFVSLFPAGDKKDAVPSLFIQFDQPLSIKERRSLRETSEESPLQLTGLVRRGGSFETKLIRKRYPNVASGPLILTWNSKAEPGAYYMASCMFLVCLFFGFVSLFVCCRSARVPVSQSARIGMTLVGMIIAVIAFSLWVAESQTTSPYLLSASFRCNFYSFESQQVGVQLLKAFTLLASPMMMIVSDPDKWDFEFVSESVPGGPQKRIKFRSTKKTEQFKRMKKDASKEIGMRMAADLADNGSVEWTPGCFIHVDAVEVPVRWSFNGGKPKRIALDQITEAEINKTTLVLKMKSKLLAKKCKIEIKQPNFFPGLDLLQQMLTITRESSESQEQKSRKIEPQSSATL